MATDEELSDLIDSAVGGDSESGKSLRKRLESTLSENRELRKEVVTSRAASLISSKGYNLVEAKDVEDVPLAELESKLESLQKERTDVLARGVRARFAAQGLSEDELNEAVEDFLAGQIVQTRPDPEIEAFERVRNLAGIAGTPVPQVNTDKLHGAAAIRAAIEAEESRKSRRR